MERLEHDISPDAMVSDLRIGEQQIVEIAKALAQDARILIHGRANLRAFARQKSKSCSASSQSSRNAVSASSTFRTVLKS
jgi:hypothetical protein